MRRKSTYEHLQERIIMLKRENNRLRDISNFKVVIFGIAVLVVIVINIAAIALLAGNQENVVTRLTLPDIQTAEERDKINAAWQHCEDTGVLTIKKVMYVGEI